MDERLRMIERQMVVLEKLAQSHEDLVSSFKDHTLEDHKNFQSIQNSLEGIRLALQQSTTTLKIYTRIAYTIGGPILVGVTLLVVKIIIGLPI